MAILIPFIGWGVYIMGLIQSEFDNLGVKASDYTTFVQAIPFQIYAILAIIMIPLIAFTKIDFPDEKVEQKAEKEKADITLQSMRRKKKTPGYTPKRTQNRSW